MWVFYIALKLIFYNRERKCLLRGTDWVFKKQNKFLPYRDNNEIILSPYRCVLIIRANTTLRILLSPATCLIIIIIYLTANGLSPGGSGYYACT